VTGRGVTGRGVTGRGGQAWGPVAGSSALEIALVNNMPDAAFEQAERQFTGLLEAGAAGLSLRIRRVSLSDPGRGAAVRRRLASSYEDVGELYRRPPAAVVVTGSEPRRDRLRDEDQWEELSRLVRWSVRSTSSVMLSCLAAHAALLDLAGVDRSRLAAKASGVYRQSVSPGHPLTEGLRAIDCPHSRLYDVPARRVQAAGFEVLLGSATGWTLAAADGPCLTVLVQGHPEYSPTTLLREYRRDVQRYLSGVGMSYPEVPEGYLDVEGVAMLEGFRREVLGRTAGPGPRLVDGPRFPFEACARHIVADWRQPVVQLFANWLTQVDARRQAGAWRRAG